MIQHVDTTTIHPHEERTMKTKLNYGICSLLTITLIAFSTASAQTQVYSSNGRAGVYVQGNGQGMAGTFDENGFHGIAVGSDGRVRRIEPSKVNPFATGQPADVGVVGSTRGAFAAAGRIPANAGGFDPFAFVFGNGSTFPASGVGAVAVPQPHQDLDTAKRAFRQGRYEDAAGIIDRMQQQGLGSVQAKQIRSLARFALQDFAPAAADAYDVLADEAAWDWASLRRMYSDRETYVQQLRHLQTAARHPEASASHHFLLAYHYLMLDQTDAARTQLVRTRQMQPENRLAERLLASLPPSIDIR
jgi:hypothetical protein